MGRRKKIEKKLLDHPDASSEARGLRVKRIRNMANLSRQQMCDGTDININSLKGWEIGRYGGLTSSGADKIIQRVAQESVRCTLDWLMYGMGPGPTAQADAALRHSSLEISEDEETKITQELLLFKQHYPLAVDFIINDDGMSPLYNIGEYVAGVNLTASKIESAMGMNCIVQMENGNVLVRQLRKGSVKDTYTLACANISTHVEKPILYDVKINYAAPISFHRKKVSL